MGTDYGSSWLCRDDFETITMNQVFQKSPHMRYHADTTLQLGSGMTEVMFIPKVLNYERT